MLINDCGKHHQCGNEFDLRSNEKFHDKNQTQQMLQKQTQLLREHKEQNYFLLMLVISCVYKKIKS